MQTQTRKHITRTRAHSGQKISKEARMPVRVGGVQCAASEVKLKSGDHHLELEFSHRRIVGVV